MKRKAQVVHEKKAKKVTVPAPKHRDSGALGLILRAGAGAGSHKGKATRGSGIKGKGKAQRLAKHRKPW